MKTYALYLLMLCFSVIGCQKDIGEDEIQSKAKKDKCCKCKDVLFLPEELNVSSRYSRYGGDTVTTGISQYKFTYENDQGDLRSIILTYPDGKKDTTLFKYKNGLLDTVIVLNTGPNELSTISKFTFINNQIDTREEFSWDNQNTPSSDGTWTFTWNGNKLSSSFYNFLGKLLFEYDQDTIKSVKTEKTPGYEWAYETSWGDRYYTSNGKNYWAKNINNKEILQYRVPFMAIPSEFDITKVVAIIDNTHPSTPPQRTEVYQYDNKYNDACYPIEINETHTGRDDFPWIKQTIKIKYKKVPLH
ncbi:hypothetical protein D3C80_289500 [compost metagenome]